MGPGQSRVLPRAWDSGKRVAGLYSARRKLLWKTVRTTAIVEEGPGILTIWVSKGHRRPGAWQEAESLRHTTQGTVQGLGTQPRQAKYKGKAGQLPPNNKWVVWKELPPSSSPAPKGRMGATWIEGTGNQLFTGWEGAFPQCCWAASQLSLWAPEEFLWLEMLREMGHPQIP